MHIRALPKTLFITCTVLLAGCATKPDVTYESWKANQTKPEIAYTANDMVKITLNWSRIGPFSRYDTWVRSNVFGGKIEVYGAQTCLGKFVRNDRMLPANGWWEIICPDESYAAGNFRLTENGRIAGTGADMNGEQVSFDLPIPG